MKKLWLSVSNLLFWIKIFKVWPMVLLSRRRDVRWYWWIELHHNLLKMSRYCMMHFHSDCLKNKINFTSCLKEYQSACVHKLIAVVIQPSKITLTSSTCFQIKCANFYRKWYQIRKSVIRISSANIQLILSRLFILNSFWYRLIT